jgi:hypothetical protein
MLSSLGPGEILFQFTGALTANRWFPAGADLFRRTALENRASNMPFRISP